MMLPRRIAGRTVAAVAAILATVMSFGLVTNSPAAVDSRDDNAGGPASQNPGGAQPAPGSAPTDNPVSANPLWAIPLQSLTATRERPVFLPSRRPPAPAVVGAPYIELQRPVAASATEPEQPQLSLVGVVAGATEGIAVFVNQATRDIIRLRTGEGHEGWILRSVNGREAVLEKNQRTAVIALPPPAGEQK